jgi:hypothetical protein
MYYRLIVCAAVLVFALAAYSKDPARAFGTPDCNNNGIPDGSENVQVATPQEVAENFEDNSWAPPWNLVGSQCQYAAIVNDPLRPNNLVYSAAGTNSASCWLTTTQPLIPWAGFVASFEYTMLNYSTTDSGGDLFHVNLSLMSDCDTQLNRLRINLTGQSGSNGTFISGGFAAGVTPLGQWLRIITWYNTSSCLIEWAVIRVSDNTMLAQGSYGAPSALVDASPIRCVWLEIEETNHQFADNVSVRQMVDCNSNYVPDEVDLLRGSALDCNSNGVPDACDLAAETSSDCNHNDIPDECEIVGAPPIAGLTLWLLTGTGVSIDAQGVTFWADQSGNGHNFTPISLSGKPALVPSALNGHPVVQFDGSDDRMDNVDGLISGNQFTLFTVMSVVSGNYPWEIGSGSPGARVFYERGPHGGASPDALDIGHDYGTDVRAGYPGISAPGFRVLSIVGDQMLSGTRVYVDGAAATTTLAGSDQNWTIGAGGNRLGGGASFPNAFTAVDVAEVLVYDRVLSQQEREDVEQYLGHKYFNVNGPSDCNSNGIPDECELAGNDCNQNNIIDACDVESGSSWDCNQNSIPDECEITDDDCNGNGVLDECEIAGLLFWTDPVGGPDSFIRSGSLDGNNPRTIVADVSHPRGIAVDPVDKEIYWTEPGSMTIRKAKFDGTGLQTVLGTGDATAGIAINVVARKLYWTESGFPLGNGQIRRSNLDGSGVEILVSGDLYHPVSISLDTAHGKMYWTDLEGHFTGAGKIQRANLDGSGVETLFTGVDEANGILVDADHGKIYWTELATRKIERSDLDGSNREDWMVSLDTPTRLALDRLEGKLYWTDSGFNGQINRIQRANLDGSNFEIVVAGVGFPWDLAIYRGNDCDNNAVLDECELLGQDCNTNGVLDACDIGDGESQDQNGNGVPDECEAQCGDGLVQIGEECDGLQAGNCPSGFCRADCMCQPPAIPAVSEWGLTILALAGLIAGSLLFRKGTRRADH